MILHPLRPSSHQTIPIPDPPDTPTWTCHGDLPGEDHGSVRHAGRTSAGRRRGKLLENDQVELLLEVARILQIHEGTFTPLFWWPFTFTALRVHWSEHHPLLEDVHQLDLMPRLVGEEWKVLLFIFKVNNSILFIFFKFWIGRTATW